MVHSHTGHALALEFVTLYCSVCIYSSLNCDLPWKLESLDISICEHIVCTLKELKYFLLRVERQEKSHQEGFWASEVHGTQPPKVYEITEFTVCRPLIPTGLM